MPRLRTKIRLCNFLLQESPGGSRNVITDEQASRELSPLSQKEDKDLYTYYRRTEGLLRGIHGKDRVSNNGPDTIILSPSEQYLIKDTIMKFILGIRDLGLRLRVVEYRAEPVPSLYVVFKKAEIYLDVLRIREGGRAELLSRGWRGIFYQDASFLLKGGVSFVSRGIALISRLSSPVSKKGIPSRKCYTLYYLLFFLLNIFAPLRC